MKPNRLILVLPFLLFLLSFKGRQVSMYEGNGRLQRIYFNLYTDSIKPILNYYVNVEGEFANGRILPLDTSMVTITADQGSMSTSEWVPPKYINFDKVTFRATARDNSALTQTITVYIKRFKDPRDEMNYDEGPLPTTPMRDYRRRR